MCELCLDSREGGACKRPMPCFGPRGGGREAFKRTKRHILAPEAVGRERRSRRVYGSQNQHMHASPVSEQVTPSSSYLSFLSMQQHPTQPTIEASQKMIATTNSALTMPARKKLTSPITKQTTAMM